MRRSLPLAFLSVMAWAASVAQAQHWPQFRGPDRNNISTETGLLREWPEGGPKVLWTVDVAQGYAAAAIYDGRVYVNDYDEESSTWFVRCLLLADGKELWRYREAKRIRPNHGITRTVPAVDGKYVFSLDPKCVFHSLNAEDGKEIWRKELVDEYKTKIPAWYAGQCPLIEKDRILIAPGGDALVVALNKADGKPIWETPNPEGWPMSHASLMPAKLGGVEQYVYCTLKGLVGVAAKDGTLLWSFPYKFNVAVAPSPLPIGEDLVFMTSGYNAGSVMVRVKRDGERFTAEEVFSLSGREWNSEVHTPILYNDRLYAVGKMKRGLFTCLGLDGKIVWDSADKASFGLGSFLLVDDMFLILEGKTGMLRLLDATADGYKELAHAQVLSGHDVWAPMALSGGRLVLRDMKQMKCIQVGASR